MINIQIYYFFQKFGFQKILFIVDKTKKIVSLKYKYFHSY